ncbi:MAG TPA: hypothetical protein VG900_06515 [Hyphomicrobiaceae bacterium]|nr:hypothetical protein [Hyphomicrobiaceae bacterium]
MLHRATLRSRTLVLIAGLLVGAATAALVRTDLQISRGFEQALQNRQPGLSFETAVTGSRNSSIAGDEGFWLTHADADSPTPFAKPLATGDRITIAGKDGRAISLEVTDIKAIASGIVRTGTNQPRLLLVTCRVAGTADAAALHPVRFIVEAGEFVPPVTASSKAL